MVMYHIYKPMRRKPVLSKICACKFVNVPSNYVACLGVVGVLLSLLDLVRVLKGGPVLPCSLLRNRIKAGSVVSPECERDLKLISLILSLEYYALLVCGILMNNPSCLLPWLCFYALIIMLEFFVFSVRIYTEGFQQKKQPLVTSMYVIYNWFVVYCKYETFCTCPPR